MAARDCSSNLSARTPGEPNDLALRGLFAAAVVRPCLHQVPPFLEEITTPVRRLNLVADGVRERHFPNLARKVRLLGRPIYEAGAKSMHSGLAGTAQLDLEQVQHRILRER